MYMSIKRGFTAYVIYDNIQFRPKLNKKNIILFKNNNKRIVTNNLKLHYE